jgi:hypothetical protein
MYIFSYAIYIMNSNFSLIPEQLKNDIINNHIFKTTGDIDYYWVIGISLSLLFLLYMKNSNNAPLPQQTVLSTKQVNNYMTEINNPNSIQDISQEIQRLEDNQQMQETVFKDTQVPAVQDTQFQDSSYSTQNTQFQDSSYLTQNTQFQDSSYSTQNTYQGLDIPKQETGPKQEPCYDSNYKEDFGDYGIGFNTNIGDRLNSQIDQQISQQIINPVAYSGPSTSQSGSYAFIDF